MSVSDKRIEPFAQGLIDAGFELLSTGGTYKRLKDAGLTVTEVSDYTEFSEMMDGRVKPTPQNSRYFGQTWSRWCRDERTRNTPNRFSRRQFISVCWNGCRGKRNACRCHWKIDIGGPTMVRAAAKIMLMSALWPALNDYDNVFSELNELGQLSDQTRFDLAVKVLSIPPIMTVWLPTF